MWISSGCHKIMTPTFLNNFNKKIKGVFNMPMIQSSNNVFFPASSENEHLQNIKNKRDKVKDIQREAILGTPMGRKLLEKNTEYGQLINRRGDQIMKLASDNYFKTDAVSNKLFQNLDKIESFSRDKNEHALKRYGAKAALVALDSVPAAATFAISKALERRKYKKALKKGDLNVSEDKMTPFILGTAVGALTGAVAHQNKSLVSPLKVFTSGDKYKTSKGKEISVGGIGSDSDSFKKSVARSFFPNNPVLRGGVEGIQLYHSMKKKAHEDYQHREEKLAEISEERKAKIKKNLKRIGIATAATAATATGAALALKGYNARNGVKANNQILAKNLSDFNKANGKNVTLDSARKFVSKNRPVTSKGLNGSDTYDLLKKGLNPVKSSVKGGASDLYNNVIKSKAKNAVFQSGAAIKDMRNAVPRGFKTEKGDFVNNVGLKDTISNTIKGAIPGVAIGLGMKAIVDQDQRDQRKFDEEIAQMKAQKQSNQNPVVSKEAYEKYAGISENLGKIKNTFNSGYSSIPKENHKINVKSGAANLTNALVGTGTSLALSVGSDMLFRKYQQHRDKKEQEVFDKKNSVPKIPNVPNQQ